MTLQGLNPREVWNERMADRLLEIFDYQEVKKVIRKHYKVLTPYFADCKSLLDVGCGFQPRLYNIPETFGIDVSRDMLTRGRQFHAHFPFIHGSAYKLPFKNKIFDGSQSLGVMRHMEHWQPVIAEMKRVTKRKLAFSLLICDEKHQCGKYQWCNSMDEVTSHFSNKMETVFLRDLGSFKNMLFLVEV